MLQPQKLEKIAIQQNGRMRESKMMKLRCILEAKVDWPFPPIWLKIAFFGIFGCALHFQPNEGKWSVHFTKWKWFGEIGLIFSFHLHPCLRAIAQCGQRNIIAKISVFMWLMHFKCTTHMKSTLCTWSHIDAHGCASCLEMTFCV